jgi:hypothetical protein
MQVGRRINHTGRRRIKTSEVQFELLDNGRAAPSFKAYFDLQTDELPADADLYVEAYHGPTSQRFSYGKVGSLTPPASTVLDRIDLSGPILFRVKVVDNSGRVGQLLAAANALRPTADENDEDRASLLTFRATDLGQLPWMLAFDDDCKPALCINNRIPEAKNKLVTNPVFQSLILPAAFREILVYILWNREGEEEEGSWQKLWIDFANQIAPEDIPESTDQIGLMGWVDDVVREFSTDHEFGTLLIRHMEERTI